MPSTPYGSLRQRTPDPEPTRPFLRRLPRDRYQLASAAGVDWTVHDYRLVDGRRRVVRLASKVATHRAFVRADGTIRVYQFRDEHHTPDPFDLERQLRAAEVQPPRSN